MEEIDLAKLEELEAFEEISSLSKVDDTSKNYYTGDNKKLNNEILEECNNVLLKVVKGEAVAPNNLRVNDILAIKAETYKENYGLDNKDSIKDPRGIIPVNIQINYIKSE